MRVLVFTNAETNIVAQDAPFIPGYDVVLLNPTAGALTLQESDVSGSGFTTLGTVPAASALSVRLNKQYVKVSTAANIIGLGN